MLNNIFHPHPTKFEILHQLVNIKTEDPNFQMHLPHDLTGIDHLERLILKSVLGSLLRSWQSPVAFNGVQVVYMQRSSKNIRAE